MSETASRIIKIATKKRYKNKYHWTDYFSYFYLFLGVLLMFGPVVWLGLSSLKTLAGIQEYPPTILPLSQHGNLNDFLVEPDLAFVESVS